MTEAGFDIKPGDHPIVPIMLYDAVVAQNFAAKLLEEGIYVIGFFYPVVAKGLARIRVQLSAAHDQHHLDKAIAAFTKSEKNLGCKWANLDCGIVNQMFQLHSLLSSIRADSSTVINIDSYSTLNIVR